MQFLRLFAKWLLWNHYNNVVHSTNVQKLRYNKYVISFQKEKLIGLRTARSLYIFSVAAGLAALLSDARIDMTNKYS